MSLMVAFLQYSSVHEYSFSPKLMLFMFLFFTTIFIISFKRSTSSPNLPPSPPNKLPVIGHLHQLGSLPHHDLQRLAQKHGPLMILHLGLSPTLIVSSPQADKEILKTHDLIFSSRPNLAITKKLFYGQDVSFSPYGEHWRQMRRICILQLLSPKRVQSFRSVREEETQLLIQKITTSCNSSQMVDLSEMIMRFTNDIICRVAFGRKYYGEEVGKKFGEILQENIYLLGVFNVEDFIPWAGWMINRLSGLNARLENSFRETDSFLDRVIDEHIAMNKKREGNEDLVDVLLGINVGSADLSHSSLGRDSIKGVILDMFVAGTDTSHSALVWAMAELMRHPNAMKLVQEEVRRMAKGKQNVTEDDLHKMQYLQCVIKETLRLHPPLPLLIPRESIEVIKIYEYDIPAKTRVYINAYAIGRDPETWKEPNMFEPERFMNSSVDYRGQDFELIPFGAGRRSCPAVGFAIAAVELALSNLLFRFDWKLAGAGAGADANGADIDMAETAGLVVHKKYPLVLVATDHFC